MSRNKFASLAFSSQGAGSAVVVKISLSHAASWGVVGEQSSSTDLTMAFVNPLPRVCGTYG